MSRQDQRSHAEEAFFGSNEVDPELVALAETPNPWTPLLLLLVSIVAAYLAVQYFGDAKYAVSKGTYAELGDVEFWQSSNSRIVNGELVLPTNRYVRLDGVAQRRAAIGSLGYTKLVGVPVFAEVPKDLLSDPDRRTTVGDYYAPGGDRHAVSQPGRLVAFEDLPRRYNGIARYLAKSFELNLCGVEQDAGLMRAFRAERDRSILELNERLGRVASSAEVLKELGPECQKAWLFQEGRSPSEHRGYLFVFLFLAIVSVSAFGLAIRWVYVFRVRQS